MMLLWHEKIHMYFKSLLCIPTTIELLYYVQYNNYFDLETKTFSFLQHVQSMSIIFSTFLDNIANKNLQLLNITSDETCTAFTIIPLNNM